MMKKYYLSFLIVLSCFTIQADIVNKIIKVIPSPVMQLGLGSVPAIAARIALSPVPANATQLGKGLAIAGASSSIIGPVLAFGVVGDMLCATDQNWMREHKNWNPIKNLGLRAAGVLITTAVLLKKFPV